MAEKEKTGISVWFWIVSLPVLLFVGFVAITNAVSPPDDRPLSERVQESCDREFGSGTIASGDCRIRLMTEELHRQRGDALDRARDGAR